MTKEAQRIAIAEASGWMDVGACTRNLKPDPFGKHVRGTRDKGSNREYMLVPDYLSDLNAMHSALSIQDEDFRLFFQIELTNEANRRGVLFIDLVSYDWAEVFLLVLNQKAK